MGNNTQVDMVQHMCNEVAKGWVYKFFGEYNEKAHKMALELIKQSLQQENRKDELIAKLGAGLRAKEEAENKYLSIILEKESQIISLEEKLKAKK